MITVFFLIFAPNLAWDSIARARHGFVYITIIHLLPLLLLGTALEGYGLAEHGKWQSQYGIHKKFSQQDVINYEAVQFVVFLTVVLASAVMIYKISQTFQDRLTFLQAYTTIAYGFSPLFLFHTLDAFADMHPAVPWLMGIALTVWILYGGIPRVMQPDPTHAFGVYLSAIIVVTMTSALARLITGMYLLGRLDLQHSLLSHEINRICHLLGH